jgi:hypothetical protein
MDAGTRIKELVDSFQHIEGLKVSVLGNMTRARQEIMASVRDANGYTNVSGVILPQTKGVRFSPNFGLEGDFVAVLTISDFLDIPRGELREVNSLIIYSKEESSYAGTHS